MTQPNNVLNTQKCYDSLIEEAAKEYSDHNYIDECVEIPAFKAGAIQMAQWKDEQVRQIQEREIEVCNGYIEKNPNNKLMLKYHLGRLSLCDELLGTDSKDKINMAFATMD